MKKKKKTRRKKVFKLLTQKLSDLWENFQYRGKYKYNSTEQNSIRQNEEKSRWNLVQWQEFLMKFDAMTRNLSRQYDIQLTAIKARFFGWYIPMKCDTAQQKLEL